MDNWIKCADKLPDEHFVLGCFYARGSNEPDILIVRQLVFHLDSKRWFYDGNNIKGYRWEIMYWMPLPLPPNNQMEN